MAKGYRSLPAREKKPTGLGGGGGGGGANQSAEHHLDSDQISDSAGDARKIICSSRKGLE